MVEISRREWEEVKGRLAITEEQARVTSVLMNRLLTEGGLEDSLTGHGYQQFGDGDYLADNIIHFEIGASASANIEWERPSVTDMVHRLRSFLQSGNGWLEMRTMNDNTLARISVEQNETAGGVPTWAACYIRTSSTDFAGSTSQILVNSAAGAQNSYIELSTPNVFLGGMTHLGLSFGTRPGETTISSGVATFTGVSYRAIDTESDAASDDLDTITAADAEAGGLLVLKSANDARDVVVKHGTGNILLSDGADRTLSSTQDRLMLIYDGSNWHELSSSIAGGAPLAISAKTTTHQALGTDTVLLGDATGGAFTITLPAVADVSTGKVLHIKKTDSSANAVTVDGSGAETIDDSLTAVLSMQYDAIMVVSDGSEWWIL